MDDLIRQVISILRGMWHRRWLGLIVAWIVGVTAAVVVWRIPDRYEASARVYVDTQSVLRPLMAGLAVQPNVEQQIAILSRTLISRPNVEKLIRSADLDLSLQSKEDHERMIDTLMKGLEIKSAGRSDLYTLAYRDSDPNKARKIVQALVSIFVESSLGDQRKDTESAKKFIEEQIKAYEKKLEEAENRVKEFKLRNIGMSGQSGDFLTQMNQLNTQLSQARLELREAENSRDALKRQIVGEEPVLLPDTPEAAAGVPIPDIDGRIDTLKRNLDGLLQRYTEEHPDVVGTKRVIEQLEEQKRQEVSARKKAAAGQPSAAMNVNANPVYQQLKVSLAEAEANLASLQTRVTEYEARYAKMQSSVRMVPQLEAEYTQLNRDYEVIKTNYNNLLTRRESANLSGQMDSAASVADFRLVDPPRVSPQPVAPNRLLLMAAAFVVSLGAGLGSSFVATQLWPSFYDSRTLREVTGLPVLGTVSHVLSPVVRRRDRNRLIAFLGGLVALVSAFGAGLIALFLMSMKAI